MKKRNSTRRDKELIRKYDELLAENHTLRSGLIEANEIIETDRRKFKEANDKLAESFKKEFEYLLKENKSQTDNLIKSNKTLSIKLSQFKPKSFIFGLIKFYTK